MLGRRHARLVEDPLVGLREARLLAELREEGGKPSVILLAPALEGMVMALGALDSLAKEQLPCPRPVS